MKTFLECIPCFLRQTLDAARMVTADASLHEQLLRDVLGLIQRMDLQQSPPAMAQLIHRRIRELAENPDPYRDSKRRHNQLALALYDKLTAQINNAPNPLEAAVRLAIAGNIIDLGVKTSLDDDDISRTIQSCLTGSLDRAMVGQLRLDTHKARRILYLTDNAGEIIFDRLLIEQLPMEKITVAVKGFPVINDATMEDARIAGLPDIVTVIDNGSDAPGTILDTCSDDFIRHFHQADVILAKGQGNYETLSDSNQNIYFILKAKCPVIASDLKCAVGQMIVTQSVSAAENRIIPSMKPLKTIERR